MNIKQSLDAIECYRFFRVKKNTKLSFFDIDHKTERVFFFLLIFYTCSV
ncbi:Uncharacterised protein [Aggregatibacter actinomycetemcomitans]|uniref:Uncharacterized protein n=1 Tax=Aggregatibacter actinomycetemcomitans serotype e str. SC1083 TaxID=907488 RepID=G4A787_AGGAC|nr:hypothetical protein SC1083_0678 [Aggregatibacter actinomycetemcomitans serotype e str. SC1083]EKX94938.1 hypothetical protein HMPREF9996_01673 [Aggregatibacter actinomycetemcomitans Y4]KYK76468.1 hypothetical protein SA2149_02575 [Aggregatibacter actinomycetemcomitans serotype e str. SA2149]SSY82079.1 Uncharacterised protein [Aggregatibacter actinomycetemcomitans]